MLKRWLNPPAAALGLLAFLSPALAGADDPPERTTPATPEFIANTSEVPDLDDWGKKAKALCETWYPRIAEMLATPGETPPPKTVELLFRKEMNGIADAGGNRIRISAAWVRAHPDDLGMVVHELTHIVQHYPRSRNSPGWLVEGIADYVRHSHFEPDARMPRLNARRSSYRDSYKTTAAFLAWLETTQDPPIVATLNRALRLGKYRDELFEERTGRNLDELWQDYTDAR